MTINLLLISLYKEHILIFQMKENASLSPQIWFTTSNTVDSTNRDCWLLRTMNLLVNRINSALFNHNDSNKTGDVKLIQSQLNRNGWDIYGKAVKTLNKIWEEQKQMWFYSSELKLVKYEIAWVIITGSSSQCINKYWYDASAETFQIPK